MAKAFMDQDFLLETPTARKLYHEFAAKQPIIDYHCHLSASEIADDKTYANITELWLGGDHYKWRFMRSAGLSEDYCTGNQPDQEKFRAFCRILPQAIGNPLYHWSQMELSRYFGINELLLPAQAEKMYSATSEKLQEEQFRARGLLEQMNVAIVCTTDDPADTLEHHESYFIQNHSVKMYPAFRPDKSFAIENITSYKTYLQRLGKAAGVEITSFDTLLEALENRVNFFHSRGCRLSDHGLENMYFSKNTFISPDQIFKKVLEGISPT